MFEIMDGEIEIKKDNSGKKIFAAACLLALAATVFLLIMSQTTRFEKGTFAVYEGTVTDAGMTGIPLLAGNSFFEPADTREYITVHIAGADTDGAEETEVAIYSASSKAPDRRKYTFPPGISPGCEVKIAAAQEIGTGLMVVQETIYYIENQETADS